MHVDERRRARALKTFRRNDEGSVAVLSAFTIMVFLMICALVLESSQLYVEKLRAQRAADIANLAAVNTKTPIVGGAPSAMAEATARQMAVVNGYPAGEVRTAVTTGSSGTPELTSRIAHESPLIFGQVLTADPFVLIGGSSSAQVSTAGGDCLRSTFGPVKIFDSARVKGTDCQVASAGAFAVCMNAVAEVRSVEVALPKAWQAMYICPGVTLTPPLASFSFDTPSVDPLAEDDRIVAIRKRLAGMTRWAYGTQIPERPLHPETSGGSDEVYTRQTVTLPSSRAYRRLSISDSDVTFPGTGSADPGCLKPTIISGNMIFSGVNRVHLGSGCYAIGGVMSNEDGADTRFDLLPGADVTLASKSYLQNKAATLHFADMKVSFEGDVVNGDEGILTFGNGPFLFGGGIVNGTGKLTFGSGPFYVNGGSIINGSGTLSFGNGKFYLWGGSMANAGTGTLSFGDGGFIFFGGTVTNVAGMMRFGDGPFEFWGGSLALGERSHTVFGAGNMNFYGGTAYFHGASTQIGGTTRRDGKVGSSSLFFYGGSFSMQTQSLTAVGTTFAFYGGSVGLRGIGAMHMTAPTADAPTFGYKNVLFFLDGGTLNLYQGDVDDVLSGIIYVPRSFIEIYGSQTVTIPSDGCLQLAGAAIDIFQKASLDMRPCASKGESGVRATLTR